MLVRSPALSWRDISGFLLAAIGAAMGLEALTSLVFLAWQHGGGAFLLAYLLAVMLLVLPVMMLELGVGVCFQASAPGGLRRLGRRLEWIGWWTTALGAIAALLASGLAAWGLVWAGEAVVLMLSGEAPPWTQDRLAADAWWRQRLVPGAGTVLPGGAVVAALIAVWALAAHILRGGMASIGRWCTVLVPVAMVLVVVLGVGFLYQPGAADGVARYLVPEWSALLEPATWAAAGRAAVLTQVLGLGVYIAYASHLERGADSAGLALVVALAGAGFAFLAGFVGAAAFGALAAREGVPVELLAVTTTREALVALTAAMAALPLGPWGLGVMMAVAALAWSILAFSTVLGLLAAVMVAVTDTFAIGWDAAVRRLLPFGFVLLLVLAAPALIAVVDDLRRAFFPTGVAIAVAAQCTSLMAVASSGNLQRHINAYSTIQVGSSWRLVVTVVVPALLVAGAVERLLVLGRPPLGLTGVLLPSLVATALALLAAITLALAHSRRRSW